jgi:hypothetical protein
MAPLHRRGGLERRAGSLLFLFGGYSLKASKAIDPRWVDVAG